MTDVKNAKDALVASLFELAKAAQDAASATVDFYKATSLENNNGEVLTQLANGLNNIAKSTSAVTAGIEDLAQIGTKAENDDVKKDGNQGTEEKKKKKKVERDPNAPKKPLTIYFAFSFYTRDQIRQERVKKGLPPLSAIEMNDIIKERWNSITPEEKAKWQKKYQGELKEYNTLKEAYKAGHLPPGKEASTPSKDKDEKKEKDKESTKETPSDIPEAPSSPELKKIKSEGKKRKSDSKKLLDDAEKVEKESKKSKKSKKQSSQSKD